MKILVVVPAYNESNNILKVIKELKEEKMSFDILVIDDASKDDTLEKIKQTDVKVISNPFNMGPARASQLGMKYGYSKGYDYVVLFDGDTQHIAKYIPTLVNKMKETNCDLVIGSRYLDKEYKQSFFRLIGTRLFRLLIKISCHKTITDPLSGMRCLNRKTMYYFASMDNFPDFIDANQVIELLLRGYEIEEVPVKMRYRVSGKSQHSGFIKPIRYMVSMIYAVFVTIILNSGRRK